MANKKNKTRRTRYKTSSGRLDKIRIHTYLSVYPLRDAKVELHPVAALLLTELVVNHLLHRCKVLRIPSAELLPGGR